jgi:hypothetical protein
MPVIGAGAEGDGEAALQAGARSFRRAHVRPHGNVHADISGRARKDRPDHEGDGFGDAEEDPDQHRHDHAHDGDGGVLAAQIGLGAFLDGGGDVLHLFVAGRRGQHLTTCHDAIKHCGKPAGYGDEHNGHEVSFP